MINNDVEYEFAVKRLDGLRGRHDDYEQELVRTGMTPDEVKRAMDPLRCFNLQFEEEIDAYKRLKRDVPWGPLEPYSRMTAIQQHANGRCTCTDLERCVAEIAKIVAPSQEDR